MGYALWDYYVQMTKKNMNRSLNLTFFKHNQNLKRFPFKFCQHMLTYKEELQNTESI